MNRASAALGAAIVSLLTLLSIHATAQATKFDLIIRGGRLVDGLGGPWVHADIAVAGDSIAAIGSLANATATVDLDARGFVVAPGFIDIHSHGAGGGPFYPGRGGLFDVPSAENYLREGVTTILEGPDGYSPLPLRPFLDRLVRTPISINFATLVGHGSIRQQIVGLENRAATAAELDRMKQLADQAMRDGAFGMSTGLFYVPGSYAPTAEVIELARVVAASGGIHATHMRDEAAGIMESIAETLQIGESARIATHITHLKMVGKSNWGKSAEALALVESARSRGVDVTVDLYPYTASSTGLYAVLPQWALEGGRQALRRRLGGDERRRIKDEVIRKLENERGGGDPRNVVIVDCAGDSSRAGKTLADLTLARGVPPTVENAAETAMEIEHRDDCSAIFHAMHEDDVKRIMASRYSMVASDGIIPVFGVGAPHPRSYGTFARVLAHYVRDANVVSLETAVWKMAGFPAQRLKLWDRGALRPGMKADIIVFDPLTVADHAEYSRPHQYASGVRDVIVNGRMAMRNGTVSPERAGRVLYGPGRKAAN